MRHLPRLAGLALLLAAHSAAHSASQKPATAAEFAVAQAADLGLTSTLDTALPFTPGQHLRITLTVSNAGPLTATGVTLTAIPSNLTLQPIPGSPCASFPCTIPYVRKNFPLTIPVEAVVTAPGNFRAGFSVGGQQHDPNPMNDLASVRGVSEAPTTPQQVTPQPDTQPVKEPPPPVPAALQPTAKLALNARFNGPLTASAGDTVSFTFQVRNISHGVARAVQLAGTPSNLANTSISGSCTALPCKLDALSPGQSATLVVTGFIAAPGLYGESLAATFRGGAPGQPAPRIALQEHTPTPSPLWPWIAGGLALLLAALALVSTLRRRRRWQTHLHVACNLPLVLQADASFTPGKPFILLQTTLNPGAAQPHGPIPIALQEAHLDPATQPLRSRPVAR